MENNESKATEGQEEIKSETEAGFSADEDFNWEADTSKASVSDSFKKVLSTGISAVMMSEEVLRQYMSEVKNPKEAASAVFKTLGKSREELVARAGNEFSKLIQKIDIVNELTQFLQENKIKISAEVEFKKKDKENT